MSENSDIFSDNHQSRCKYYFGMPDTDITKIKSWNFCSYFCNQKHLISSKYVCTEKFSVKVFKVMLATLCYKPNRIKAGRILANQRSCSKNQFEHQSKQIKMFVANQTFEITFLSISQKFYVGSKSGD